MIDPPKAAQPTPDACTIHTGTGTATSEELAASALATFDAVVHDAGLRTRDGQRIMAQCVAQTLASADLGRAEDVSEGVPRQALAVIQAGTGVGKSLAYSAPAIALALARGTRVLISTATVALQEQLVGKDLPALARHMSHPLRFVLAKGRGRFVCKFKLERLSSSEDSPDAGLGDDDDIDDFFPTTPATGNDSDNQPQPDAATLRSQRRTAARRQSQLHAQREARIQLYSNMADALSSGRWDGERDSLHPPPSPEVWAPIAAEGHTCTARHCPVFGNCTYYQRRREMVAAQVIVVNHDLLLSSLGSQLLPAPQDCLIVMDEAHHLPHTALSQFASHMDLSHLQWLERLSSRALRVGQIMQVQEIAHLPEHSSGLRRSLGELARLVQQHYASQLLPTTGQALARAAMAQVHDDAPAPMHTARAPHGQLPQPIEQTLHDVLHHADGFLGVLRNIATALRNAMREGNDDAQRLGTFYAQLGALVPRMEAVHATTRMLLTPPGSTAAGSQPASSHTSDAPPTVPHAKWFTLQRQGDFTVLLAHASPILPGASLRRNLWEQARAVVLTSATLTSCGQFDFFLRESGLQGLPHVRTLEVASPFLYAAQGTLLLHRLRHSPTTDAQQFASEMIARLMCDLSQLRSGGALVLFTSRQHMRQAVDALPSHMHDKVLVQNARPRAELLRTHRQRVADGQCSIIFGLQSFGEGLDLPGAQCEHLFITKLPFAPPDDPVGEARAEWLRTSGRNPFAELVLPATAIRLAQWTGRAIRTEDDVARIHCYDPRLPTTAYGQQLLRGLPAFSIEHVA